MKHIKLFEGFDDGIYDVKDIYSWWAEINVTEDDEYYIIDLKNEWLTNKIIQLNHGLKGKLIHFKCKNHIKIETLKIKRIEYINDLIFHTIDGDTHSVDLKYPIKISKLDIAIDKYNL